MIRLRWRDGDLVPNYDVLDEEETRREQEVSDQLFETLMAAPPTPWVDPWDNPAFCAAIRNGLDKALADAERAGTIRRI